MTEVFRGVRITHPDRIVDEATGTTKSALAAYYDAMADYVLPYVAGRPLAVVRCPEGADRSCFFQKQRTPGMPAAIGEAGVGQHRVLHVADAAGLLSLVQFGAVELHVWGSRLVDVHRPDVIVMDLDPAPDVPFTRTVAAAHRVRGMLQELGLESFVRTTGGKGLHVLAPLVPGPDFAAVRQHMRSLSERLVREHPREYVSTASKEARGGKIFIDYLRNGDGATSIAPYSVRARPGCPVAMPLDWDGLDGIDPRTFDVVTVPGIVAARPVDPWARFHEAARRFPAPSRETTGSRLPNAKGSNMAAKRKTTRESTKKRHGKAARELSPPPGQK